LATLTLNLDFRKVSIFLRPKRVVVIVASQKFNQEGRDEVVHINALSEIETAAFHQFLHKYHTSLDEQ
jgi:poly-D-alanine transfer protein DltD